MRGNVSFSPSSMLVHIYLTIAPHRRRHHHHRRPSSCPLGREISSRNEFFLLLSCSSQLLHPEHLSVNNIIESDDNDDDESIEIVSEIEHTQKKRHFNLELVANIISRFYLL